jgi:hypothetical protein
MKKIAAVLLLSFGFIVGCGPSFDKSKAGSAESDEDVTEGIQGAIDSGEIDPATYGKSEE